MKKVMLVICLTAIGFASQAQIRQGPRHEDQKQEGPRKDRIEMAQVHLELTEDQVTEWYKIHAKFIEEKSALEESRREEMKKMKEEMEAELKATLTKEQAAKFIVTKARMDKRKRGHGPRN